MLGYVFAGILLGSVYAIAASRSAGPGQLFTDIGGRIHENKTHFPGNKTHPSRGSRRRAAGHWCLGVQQRVRFIWFSGVGRLDPGGRRDDKARPGRRPDRPVLLAFTTAEKGVKAYVQMINDEGSVNRS